jgi:hypothetical protein
LDAEEQLRALLVLIVVVLVASAGAATQAPSGEASVARVPWYQNCTALNKTYPHGVGKVGARDKTSDTPVTTFKRSNALFRLATSHNKGLDRDNDGIACEKE